jgi:hypothetical protein
VDAVKDAVKDPRLMGRVHDLYTEYCPDAVFIVHTYTATRPTYDPE